ncbi:unnamed protein product [Diatraea saccharalis]|uniref:Uncharacterized protein n=1 Tax=Diatraea saccharalis TaxID=40085 RepID=A0A9N9R4A4_9NEOP|nr:unnamed protein product [Diatraea saccharalis]
MMSDRGQCGGGVRGRGGGELRRGRGGRARRPLEETNRTLRRLRPVLLRPPRGRAVLPGLEPGDARAPRPRARAPLPHVAARASRPRRRPLPLPRPRGRAPARARARAGGPRAARAQRHVHSGAREYDGGRGRDDAGAGAVPRGPGGVHEVPRAAAARHAVVLQRRDQLLDHRVHHRVRQGRGVLRDSGRHEAHQGVRVRGGGARRGGRALPVRGDAVLPQGVLRLLERVPQARARLRRLRGLRLRVGRRHRPEDEGAAGARQAGLVRALQPRGREAAGQRVRRRARQAVGAQPGAVRGHARGQVQRVLRALQPALLLPPGVRLRGPLRALLRPARAAAAAAGVPRPPQGGLVRAVPGRALARLRLHGRAAEAVARAVAALRALLQRPRQREELRRPGHRRPLPGLRLREQRAVPVLPRAVAAAARVPLRGGARAAGARAARRGARRLRVRRLLAARHWRHRRHRRHRRARAAGRQQPGHHQGARARLNRGASESSRQ